jgi:kinesin family protein 11
MGRPRNNKEIKDNSPNIITAPSSKELTIKTINESSKTYTFDKVFGPDASQAQVYEQVMSGMLSEVLEGYNVTVFAYGQTGTGKTFTMLGDEPSTNNAGIIPRSLISLFDSLEKDVAEYSVRVSVILSLNNQSLSSYTMKNSRIYYQRQMTLESFEFLRI